MVLHAVDIEANWSLAKMVSLLRTDDLSACLQADQISSLRTK